MIAKWKQLMCPSSDGKDKQNVKYSSNGIFSGNEKIIMLQDR